MDFRVSACFKKKLRAGGEEIVGAVHERGAVTLTAGGDSKYTNK